MCAFDQKEQVKQALPSWKGKGGRGKEGKIGPLLHLLGVL